MSADRFFDQRAAGVLLHPTSLPVPGVGDLGPAAYRFVDWLVAAGQSYWQILPLVPVDAGGSPYNGLSAMAVNPLLIAPDLLVREGLLEPWFAANYPIALSEAVDYPSAVQWREQILRSAYGRFQKGRNDVRRERFEAFRRANAFWLEDYALFRAIREQQAGAPWTSWPDELRRREPAAVARSRAELEEEIEFHAFQQFLAETQWHALRQYALTRGVRIIGDIPIFVAHDSADVWVNPEHYWLDESGAPTVVSGVPPDYFSPTGQRWGNPLYRWDVLGRTGYGWWVERFRRAFELVDVARVDHFRGFQACWEIDAADETAMNGRWVAGPGIAFFREVERQLGPLPLIAEDLGVITPDVEQLRDELGYPGMRVLQFAFDGDPDNPHLPENHPRRSVAYTGTHDNSTTLGWWSYVDERERRVVHEILRGHIDHWRFIEAVMESRALLAVVPLQDVLGLGNEARMNTPGEPSRNWSWRMSHPASIEAARRLREATVASGRSTQDSDSPADQRPENV